VPSRAAAVLRKVVQIEPGEGAKLFWACAFHFLLFTSYFILRPLRDVKGLETRGINVLFVYTLAAMLVLNPIFASLVARFPRRVFIPVAYQFFALNLLVFAALFWKLGANVTAAGAFFVWVSVFNLFVVSVFWAFMADLFHSDQAKRLYGFIGIWGTTGALLGPSLSKWLVARLDFHGLVILSAALLEAAIFCATRLAKRLPSEREERRPAAAVPAASVLVGVRRTFQSRYLLAICGWVLLFTISSTLIYFQRMTIVDASFPHDRDGQAKFLATIEQYAQFLTLVVQLFLTGRILRWLGIGGALAILPALTLVGGASLAIWSSATLLVGLEIVRRASDFASAKPAREALYTVVGREDKYVAKNFMDTFVYRLGDLAGNGLDVAIKSLKLGMSGVAYLFLPLAVGWLGLSVYLGRRHRERAAVAEASAPPEPAIAGAR
jgi:ATP:ADP antiporter, AAA family